MLPIIWLGSFSVYEDLKALINSVKILVRGGYRNLSIVWNEGAYVIQCIAAALIFFNLVFGGVTH